MPDFVNVEYAQTGKSTSVDPYGMREMQRRAFSEGHNQYLLIKAPPASGKSRALMFLGLDKLANQGIRKVIVAVPERSIGASFNSVALSDHGFFADWVVEDRNNLCIPGGEKSKVEAFVRFMRGEEQIVVCTHATLRFAFDQLTPSDFDDCLLAIDEFHHVSADIGNKLGELIRSIMGGSSAHIVAMTGSYFRGDTEPVLSSADEAKFTKVTYNYYEQLNGYTFLKSLGIGYHFYQGRYTSAIGEVLDTDRKTIVHIPSVQSAESTKQKHDEVDAILDLVGDFVSQDPVSGVLSYQRKRDGRIIKVADLVMDDPRDRDRIVNYLRNITSPEDIDLIIALGMAKEGFDWPFCEHALTVGYRGSLTEIIQIIGRCTRDSPNKTHAQFTNLIAQPDATDDYVKLSVNNMLKAITASLLMEQVLAPNFKFKARLSDTDIDEPGVIRIKGFKEPKTARVAEIIESDLNDLKAVILQDDQMLKAMPGNVDPEVINKVLIPKIIREKYPELDDEEVDVLRQHVVVDSVIKNGEIKESGDKRFVRMADKFINIDEINIDLIDSVNPFQKAFEVLSKSVTSQVLKVILDIIDTTRLEITEEEAVLLYPKVKLFVDSTGAEPELRSKDPLERRLAETLAFLRKKKREVSQT